MNKSFLIELTPEQASALLQLIDLAVKSGGLSVAPTAVFFQEHIQAAHKRSQECPAPQIVEKPV
jgi:hypothetical protein